jgi:hypothetical protein
MPHSRGSDADVSNDSPKPGEVAPRAAFTSRPQTFGPTLEPQGLSLAGGFKPPAIVSAYQLYLSDAVTVRAAPK